MYGWDIRYKAVEKIRECSLETRLLYLDYKRAFKCILRSKPRRIMEIRGLPAQLIELLKVCIHQHIFICMSTVDRVWIGNWIY
jgi:hypothetical protein